MKCDLHTEKSRTVGRWRGNKRGKLKKESKKKKRKKELTYEQIKKKRN